MRAVLCLVFTFGIGCGKGFPERDFPDNPAKDYDGDGLTELDGDCDDTRDYRRILASSTPPTFRPIASFASREFEDTP